MRMHFCRVAIVSMTDKPKGESTRTEGLYNWFFIHRTKLMVREYIIFQEKNNNIEKIKKNTQINLDI